MPEDHKQHPLSCACRARDGDSGAIGLQHSACMRAEDCRAHAHRAPVQSLGPTNVSDISRHK